MSVGTETKRIINKYYRDKIKQLYYYEQEAEKRYNETVIDDFNKYKNKIGIDAILDDINIIYDQEFSIELSKYKVKGFENTKECKDIREEIKKLEKELDSMLFVFESLPKTSEEYKKAIVKINKIIKESK